MTQEGSTFLYAEENKSFYLDSFKKKVCPQSKMISLLIDKDESEENLTKYIEHVSGCDDCRAKLKKTKKFTTKIDRLIPDPIIPKDVQENFEIQLGQLIKEVGVKAVKYQPSFWQKTKSFLNQKII